MLSDLASEVLKVTERETQSAHFALEKTVMEKSCLLRVEWPIQRFSIRIHNNKPIVVESLFEAASIFCIALCNTGLQFGVEEKVTSDLETVLFMGDLL